MDLSNAIWVFLGCSLSGLLTALTGIPMYLRRQSLAGDALAHALLPGVCLGIWLSGYRNHWLVYLAGTGTGLLSLALVNTIHKRSKIPEDGATGISLVLFFGLGLTLLSSMQRSGLSNSGVQHLIMGKAAAMLPSEVYVLGGLFILALMLATVLFRSLWLFCFDPEFAQSSGMPMRQTEWLLNLWVALVVTASIRSIGMVLTAALLITPAAIGHFITFKPKQMIGISMFSAGIAGALAAWWSAYQPGISTGAAMVVLLSLLAFFALMAWPKRGYLSRYWIGLVEKRRWTQENILKELWKSNGLSDQELAFRCGISDSKSLRIKRIMGKKGLIAHEKGRWMLSSLGLEKASSVVRRHRLWESYLHERLHLPTDHLHDNAEIVEHLLTDELEGRLEAILSKPEQDPHQSQIPYKRS
jgi:manganese/zinc/iron transport system permease protein